MPRWDRRLRIVLDWTVALFFRPDITRIDLRVEREQVEQARRLVEKHAGTPAAVAATGAGATFPQRLPGSEGTLSRNV
jgi:hypothetical protein